MPDPDLLTKSPISMNSGIAAKTSLRRYSYDTLPTLLRAISRPSPQAPDAPPKIKTLPRNDVTANAKPIWMPARMPANISTSMPSKIVF